MLKYVVEHHFRISAVNSIGTSPPSDISQVRVVMLPSQPILGDVSVIYYLPKFIFYHWKDNCANSR